MLDLHTVIRVEGGELFDRVVSLGQLTELDAKFLFLQIVYAVKYLHENGITHRDLKPENILLASNESRCLVKVTDFGLSKFVDEHTMLRTFCGTPTYLAPELLKDDGSGAYTPAVDVWSLGVILYVCLVGYPPFSEERQEYSLKSQITQGLYDFPDEYWKDISMEAKDLVKKMLVVEPSQRLTIQNVLKHPWFSDSEIRNQVDTLLNVSIPSSSSTTGVIVTQENEMSTLSFEPTTFPEPQKNGSTSLNLDNDRDVGDNMLLKDQPVIRKRQTVYECPVPRKQHLP